MKKTSLLTFFVIIVHACSVQNDHNSYEEQLASLREQYKQFHTHAPRFFLFGMGNRDKYIYKDFSLTNIENDSVVYRVPNAISDSIIPWDYSVQIRSKNGLIEIKEDEDGIWIHKENHKDSLSFKKSKISLPSFDQFKYGKVLRVLHHELLFNIRNYRIYPNILVYKEPFYRDAFMASLCLEKTGNTHLLYPWISKITNIYDMQNREKEPDNLGELLYMLSFLPSDSAQDLKNQLLHEIEKQTIQKDGYVFIKGHTDGANNADYQTQILKFALQKNSLPDNFTDTPTNECGDYYDLCWFTRGNKHKRNIILCYKDFKFNYKDSPFPYLQWARSHYYNNHNAAFNWQNYPLSWEKRGGSAHFEGMSIISKNAVEERICYPHLWTAAEMFLKLYEEK